MLSYDFSGIHLQEKSPHCTYDLRAVFISLAYQDETLIIHEHLFLMPLSKSMFVAVSATQVLI